MVPIYNTLYFLYRIIHIDGLPLWDGILFFVKQAVYKKEDERF